MDIGVALWSMQSTAHNPVNHAAAYASLPQEARLAEELGFASFWVAEHHFWYDGWCPAPLVAAGAAAAATTRIRVGTAMLLLPMHDPDAIARSSAMVDRLSDGRLDLGVGLGYRDEEFDGLGVPRSERGRRMSDNLDRLQEAWSTHPTVQDPGPPIWVGGMARAALERGARRGCNFLLPPTLKADEVAVAVDRIRETARSEGVPMGRVGMIKDTWVDEDGDRARAHLLPRLSIGTREYAFGWWVFKDGLSGSDRPDLVQKQVDRAHDAALVGTPDEVAADVEALADAGVDTLALHVHRAATREGTRECLELIADRLLPTFRGVSHA